MTAGAPESAPTTRSCESLVSVRVVSDTMRTPLATAVLCGMSFEPEDSTPVDVVYW